MTDKWSGFADLLATLIEKHAGELDIEHFPDKDAEWEEKGITKYFQVEYVETA